MFFIAIGIFKYMYYLYENSTVIFMLDDNITTDKSKVTFKEKITSLQDVIKNFRLTLEGYVWSGKHDGWVDTGEPLASTRVVDLLVGLLTPFTNNSNLITIKDFDTFNRQQLWFCQEVNKILHTEPFSKTQNYTQVFQITDDTFQNLGDIMLGSKSLMKDIATTVEPTDIGLGG